MRQRSGELPLSQRQDREDATQDRGRRAFPVAGVAACAAQRVPACAQLRLSASQLQALDRFAASVVEVRSGPGFGMVQATSADPVHVLRGGDGDRQNADCVAVLRSHAGAHCHSGDAVTM